LNLSSVYSEGTTIDLQLEYGGSLADGHYRFSANGAMLTDRWANPLDGNGDGVGGDVYAHFFDVALPAGYVGEGLSNDSTGSAEALALDSWNIHNPDQLAGYWGHTHGGLRWPLRARLNCFG
ncbi:MAG: hypothetical protein RL464_851, partial [Actinomycetota bacterium]